MGHGAMHSYVLETPEGNPRHLGLHIVYIYRYIYGWWFQPLRNMSSEMGRMKSHI
jgi:hypothetical protein